MVHGMAWCRAVHGMGHAARHSTQHSPGHGAVPGAGCCTAWCAAWCGPAHCTVQVARQHGTARHGAWCSASPVPAYIPSLPWLYVCLSEPSVCPVEGCLLVTVWCWYFVPEWVLFPCVCVCVCRLCELSVLSGTCMKGESGNGAGASELNGDGDLSRLVQ